MDPVITNDNGKRPLGQGRDRDRWTVNPVHTDLTSLRQYRDDLTKSDRKAFRDRYGRIDFLLEVSTDWEAIRTLVRFYDPKLRTFVLPNLDLTPTIEEYYYLLSMPKGNFTDIYVLMVWNPGQPR